MALMALAQLHRDPLAALDRTLPRVPAAVIPSATEQRAANDAKHTSTTQAPTVLEVSYDLVERRAAGALILPLHHHTRRSRADLTEAEEQRQAAALELQLVRLYACLYTCLCSYVDATRSLRTTALSGLYQYRCDVNARFSLCHAGFGSVQPGPRCAHPPSIMDHIPVD